VATSPITVVAALRQSRKGRLSYDRHWETKDSSVERVIKEVTCGLEGMGMCDENQKVNVKSGKGEFNSV